MIVDIFATLRWWLAIFVIGAAATPLTWYFFGSTRLTQRLPSLGYPFAKLVGLLLVSYFFWLLGSLGFLQNGVGGILFALLIVVALSLWAQRKREQSIKQTVGQNWQLILFTELLFAAALFFWAWVRAQYPSIVNTEKPMEFAFLNAIGRSPTFPPLDPWLSGFAISYYYFGYVMVSVLARLAMVREAMAFNLATAWLFAGTIVGAFGVIYDLITLSGGTQSVQEGIPTRRTGTSWPMVIALVGALGIGLAGNLEIVLEVAHANGVGSAEFWENLDIQDINTPPVVAEVPRYETTNWWWWRSSRVINEYHLDGRNETGLNPIAEVPSFSFALGDVHPHVLALPYAFLSIAVALVWFIKRDDDEDDSIIENLKSKIKNPFFWFSALVIGGLSFLNTWDVLVHLFVLVGAIGLTRWRRDGQWGNAIVQDSILAALAFGVVAYLLYLPFYIGFSSQAGAPYILPMLMRPTRLAHFLVIFGMPLFVVTLLIGTLIVQQKFRFWQRGLATAIGLVVLLFAVMTFMGFVIGVADFGRISNLANELNIQLTNTDGGTIGASVSAVAKLLPTVLRARIAYPLVTLLLSFLIGGSVMIASHQLTANTAPVNDKPNTEYRIPNTVSPLPFVLLLILTAALLTIGPEFVYLRDQFGQRLNTIFKFYYQAWALYGVAAAVGLYILVQRTRIIGAIAGVGYVTLFAGSMLFPYYMIQWADASYTDTPTLDGLAFVDVYNKSEYDAIRWLQTQIDGTPVILEAVGGAYSDYGRVAARTGLPTLLGWANHERQWRGADHPEPGEREPVVSQIYEQPDWFGISDLLDQYNIDYVYVGSLERSAYGEQGLQKFAENMEVAFQNEMVTIYAWK